ncbi:FGGY-family carbohydrate kinase [Neomegalonema perideroedes]|uniref:FGGY-family carbohydrate kinase n=1 Tax=Neomegalonema perideroedes TaxID=217219 RepID=UPI0003747323|nr:FGGY-family carbohydrate kinase [Neomegalonema perideroedes]
MRPLRKIAVLDFGKTNVKLALVDLERRAEIDLRRRPNLVARSGPYPHHPTAEHWAFILDSLKDLAAAHEIDAISIAAHGATGALVDAAGDLVLPILDYEHEFDPGNYDALRPDFAETGSPRLAMGLNLGAQLYWQARAFPEDFARAVHLLTYPQYWMMRLSGVPSTEATSLGCHTDLWNPHAGDFSSLVARMGWRKLMPPLRRAAEILGPILPEVAARTGLRPETPVFCGLHDSNASLYPHLAAREGPFSVVSTGTWVVCMAVGAEPKALDPRRDALINVDAHGSPTPSARFMGGREYELIRKGRDLAATPEAAATVLARGILLLPAVEPSSGPFRGRKACWSFAPADEAQEAAGLAFYLALMTAECLAMIGARGPILVEGPFARNAEYRAMLAAASGRPVEASEGATGTALGAALLADSGARPAPPQIESAPPAPAFAAYAALWREALRDV